MVMVLFVFSKILGLGYECMDSHMTTKLFEIDGLTNLEKYGAPFVKIELKFFPYNYVF